MSSTLPRFALAACVAFASPAFAEEADAGTCSLPEHFVKAGGATFEPNDVSRQLSDNFLTGFFLFQGWKIVTADDLNTPCLPDDPETRKEWITHFNNEYFAKTFQKGTEQHRLAELILKDQGTADDFLALLDLVNNHPVSFEFNDGLRLYADFLRGVPNPETLTFSDIFALDNFIQQNRVALHRLATSQRLILALNPNDKEDESHWSNNVNIANPLSQKRLKGYWESMGVLNSFPDLNYNGLEQDL